jgi:hypothetical protein
MAEGFFKSRAHLINQLASSLGRRPRGEGSGDSSLAVSLAPMSDLPPTAAAVPALSQFYDEGPEPNTGVRTAVDGGPATPEGAQQRPTLRAPETTSTSEGNEAVQQTPRTSGFQKITVRSVRAPNDAVRAANVEFEDRVGDRIELPLAVLINQRDRALRDLAEAHAYTEQALQEQAAEHDQDLAEAERALTELRLEVEENRAAAVRLQGERDEAIRSIDAVRAELASEIDNAREEVVELQARFDASERALSDARDQARDEVAGLNEQLAELRRRLDESSV